MISKGEPNSWDVNYINNSQTGNPYCYTYNPGWREHPYFSYKNNYPQQAAESPGFQGQNGVISKKKL